MIFYALILWVLAAPMGFIVGRVHAPDGDYTWPAVCAIVPPLGALVACMIILNEEMEE